MFIISVFRTVRDFKTVRRGAAPYVSVDPYLCLAFRSSPGRGPPIWPCSWLSEDSTHIRFCHSVLYRFIYEAAYRSIGFLCQETSERRDELKLKCILCWPDRRPMAESEVDERSCERVLTVTDRIKMQAHLVGKEEYSGA
jgi:hypothetical protein